MCCIVFNVVGGVSICAMDWSRRTDHKCNELMDVTDELGVLMPNGWELTLSNEVYESADGMVYEGSGIPVEVEALLFDPDYRANQLDSAIEAALQQVPSN